VVRHRSSAKALSDADLTDDGLLMEVRVACHRFG
jgi:hypothetical protein